MDEQVFNNLCKIVICEFSDCTYEHQAQDAAERLQAKGIDTDPEAAYDQYEEMVKDYALEHLPTGYDIRHDYYGAKTITKEQGWKAPKTGLYSGDDQGRIMFFEDFASLKEYTNQQVANIEADIDALIEDE